MLSLQTAHTYNELDRFERVDKSSERQGSLSARMRAGQERRRMMASGGVGGGQQYIGSKVKSDFQKAGISHWAHNGTKLNNIRTPNPSPNNGNKMTYKSYKDLDIKVRQTASPQVSSSNGLTISRINDFGRRRSEAPPLRPIVQNQQIIRYDIQYLI